MKKVLAFVLVLGLIANVFLVLYFTFLYMREENSYTNEDDYHTMGLLLDSCSDYRRYEYDILVKRDDYASTFFSGEVRDSFVTMHENYENYSYLYENEVWISYHAFATETYFHEEYDDICLHSFTFFINRGNTFKFIGIDEQGEVVIESPEYGPKIIKWYEVDLTNLYNYNSTTDEFFLDGDVEYDGSVTKIVVYIFVFALLATVGKWIITKLVFGIEKQPFIVLANMFAYSLIAALVFGMYFTDIVYVPIVLIVVVILYEIYIYFKVIGVPFDEKVAKFELLNIFLIVFMFVANVILWFFFLPWY